MYFIVLLLFFLPLVGSSSTSFRRFFCHCFKYRSATHPDLNNFDSTSFNCNLSGRLTPSSNRLPSPATVGPTTKRYSSTRPSSISCEGRLTPPSRISLPCS